MSWDIDCTVRSIFWTEFFITLLISTIQLWKNPFIVRIVWISLEKIYGHFTSFYKEIQRFECKCEKGFAWINHPQSLNQTYSKELIWRMLTLQAIQFSSLGTVKNFFFFSFWIDMATFLLHICEYEMKAFEDSMHKSIRLTNRSYWAWPFNQTSWDAWNRRKGSLLTSL